MGSGVEQDNLEGPFKPKPFQDSMISSSPKHTRWDEEGKAELGSLQNGI